MPNKLNDPRYPWTYADDYIRRVPDTFGNLEIETKLSRAEASRIISLIAQALNVTSLHIATALADLYLKGKTK